MDCIKTEPDPDAEVHSPSCSVIQLVDIKQEEQPLAISFPPARDGNDVSCQCVCCYWHVAVKTCWWFIWYLSLSCWNSEILHAIYSSLQLYVCIILILLTPNFFCPTLKGHDVCKDYALYQLLFGSITSQWAVQLFVITFTACLLSYSGLLCSVIRQVEHWCWCSSAMCSVSVSSLNVDQLISSFVCDILPCCWVFCVWHFDTACRYHSPTNITLYSWTGKISCYFLHTQFHIHKIILVFCVHIWWL